MKKIGLTILMVISGLILISCGESNGSIVGTWERDNTEHGTSIMDFNDDGTGSWEIDSSTPFEFEWSTDGGILTMEFLPLGVTEPLEREYRLEDGLLIFGMENGNEFIYNRIEE